MGNGQSIIIAKAVNKQNTSKVLLYKLYFNPFGTDGYSSSHPCFYSIFNRVAHFV